MVNRKDFRPSDREYSSSRPMKAKVTDKKSVVKSFIKGESARTGNESLHTDGKVLYSYNTAIGVRQSDGTVLVNNTKYSSTTSSQQNLLKQELQSSGTNYDVTGGKDRGYQGEDFSKHNTSPYYKGNPTNEQLIEEDKTNISFKEKRLEEKKEYLAEKIHGKKFEKLKPLQQDSINDFLYKEHGYDVREAEKKHKQFIRSERQNEKTLKEVQKEQSEHPQLSKKEAETIVKQHHSSDVTKGKYNYELVEKRSGRIVESINADSKQEAYNKIHRHDTRNFKLVKTHYVTRRNKHKEYPEDEKQYSDRSLSGE